VGEIRNIYKQLSPSNIMIKSMVKTDKINTKINPGVVTKITKPKQITKAELEKQLVDNFVNLQRVLTNLSIKFDTLSDNISKLLQLFEISAKSFVEKLPEMEKVVGGERDKEFLNKVDTLLEQNKTIAKGLTLIEEKLRGAAYSHEKEDRESQRPRYPQF